MEYRIVPTADNKAVFASVWDTAAQQVLVDYARKMVILPIFSSESEPFRRGFYYLHVELASDDS